MNRTLEYYNNNAAEFCDKHDRVRLNSFFEKLFSEMPKGAKLLEAGFGSGRDAALVYAEGYDVTALDGSENLIKEAAKRHPELQGRLVHTVLPNPLPFKDGEFDGFYSVACLMHLPDNHLLAAMKEFNRVIKPAGKGLISVPACRPDVSDTGTDPHNREYHMRTIEAWMDIFHQAGFEGTYGDPEPDKLGREGITWRSFLLSKQ